METNEDEPAPVHADNIRQCILATSPAALCGLTNELIVLKNQAAACAAEALAPRKSDSGANTGALPRGGPKQGDPACPAVRNPRLMMRSLVAMAAVRHGWDGEERWKTEEARWLSQQVGLQKAWEGSNGEGDVSKVRAQSYVAMGTAGRSVAVR